MKTLSTYMSEHGLSPHEMAQRLGCSEGAVRKWVYGERMPSAEWMRAIAKATDREVMPNDFVLAGVPVSTANENEAA
jgi:DNA-binding transcriptional regulator YdaS (Cro superfamily)